MSWALLLALTAITVGSRVLPLALLPAPRGRGGEILGRLPAPLFAALAALALLDGGTVPGPPVLLAAVGAVLGAARRSLPLTLVLGLAGFALGQAVLG